ncbi:MAG: hypothetical protein K8S16_15050 [Bacteroidales bacterium]|nr:hypothetical protein [Bacteroidales bacterium]
MIRDRKMYVCPTPFAIADGLIGTRTLILPDSFKVDKRIFNVGKITRVEANQIVIGYEFDLTTNEISTREVNNPNKGKEHKFKAYRLKGESSKRVNLIENVNEKGN